MRYLLLSVLVVCVIGVMIPNVFAESSPIGESIIKEKDCEIIGKELDPNIECRLVLKNWDAILEKDFWRFGYSIPRATAYDSDNNIVYFSNYDGHKGGNIDRWKTHYVAVEMDNFTIVDVVKCDGVTTGTYVQTTTYSCELQYTPRYIGGEAALQTKTTTGYQYVVKTTHYDEGREKKLIVNSCGEIALDVYGEIDCKNRSIIHTYNTDMEFSFLGDTDPKIFLNEDKNELYYFMCKPTGGIKADCVIYLINGMGELKSAAAASEPEPTQSSGGCGEGTELVNGVCQLTKTSGTSQEDSFGVNSLVPIIIPIIAIVGIIVLVKSRKKKSSITQPTPEKTKPKPRRKPAESRPTSSSCSNCGNSLKKTAKFCGSCGTPVS